jgi:two-component system response regulator NreC
MEPRSISTSTPARVVIADDHETIRQGLRALFEPIPDLEVVQDVADGDSALEAVNAASPDVIVLDLSMPPRNGIPTIASIKATHPEVAIVVLTRHRDAAYVKEAFGAGALGYVLKQSPFSELERAVRAALKGERHVDKALRMERSGEALSSRTTARELDVLRRSALGFANKEIANELGIALKTVEVHKANVMRKLGLRTRNELVRYAVMQGWLRDP